MTFAHRCKSARDNDSNGKVLILETEQCKAISTLLQFGFIEDDIVVCNHSRHTLEAIGDVHPHVTTVHGDIRAMSKTGMWLGVWFDLETASLDEISFCNMRICAITLTNAHAMCSADLLCDKLKSFLNTKDTIVHQQPYVCKGKGGICNMCFGICDVVRPRCAMPERLLGAPIHVPIKHFGVKKYGALWIRDCFVDNDHIVGSVTSVGKDGTFGVKFLANDGYMFQEEDEWRPSFEEVYRFMYSRLRHSSKDDIEATSTSQDEEAAETMATMSNSPSGVSKASQDDEAAETMATISNSPSGVSKASQDDEAAETMATISNSPSGDLKAPFVRNHPDLVKGVEEYEGNATALGWSYHTYTASRCNGKLCIYVCDSPDVQRATKRFRVSENIWKKMQYSPEWDVAYKGAMMKKARNNALVRKHL